MVQARQVFILTVYMILLSFQVLAQTDESGVNVKITREVDGETKTFERNYKSMDDMNSDEEFQEFVGDGEDGNFLFSSDDEPFIMSSIGSSNNFLFDLREGAMEESLKIVQLLTDNGGLKEVEMTFDKINDELIEMGIDIKNKSEGQSGNFFTYSTTGGEGIIIKDPTKEFGKRAIVEDNDRLEGDVKIRSYGFNNQLQVSIKTETKGDLEIGLFNAKDKAVLQRYIEDFNGRYKEVFDLESQKAGEYILEIKVKEKRLTKLLVID